MTKSKPPEKGWRGSAELWLDAAYTALVEGGIEAVKVMPLAAKLGLSRTSFYWHFVDREALLAGLVERWKSRNTASLILQTQAPARTITEALLNVIDCWITPSLFDSRMEFAIRTWALNDPGLATTIAGSDEQRIVALAATFERFGYGKGEARIRAQTVYLTQVGYITMRTEETLALRLARIPDYVLIFTGQAPSDAELAVFRDRNCSNQT